MVVPITMRVYDDMIRLGDPAAIAHDAIAFVRRNAATRTEAARPVLNHLNRITHGQSPSLLEGKG